jgi:hypothetical protein
MIDHKNKFIYTKIAKTGGTSIYKMLLESSVSEDISHKGHWHLADQISEKTKDYFKFSFVRNPWERAVSYYFYKRQRLLNNHHDEKDLFFTKYTFEQYLLETDKFTPVYNWKPESYALKAMIMKHGWYHNQIDWLTDDKGVPLVDYVGKLENIAEEMPIIFDRLGMSNVPVKHVNKSRHKHYTKYYTSNEMIEAVEKLWGKDVKLYNYKFGE